MIFIDAIYLVYLKYSLEMELIDSNKAINAKIYYKGYSYRYDKTHSNVQYYMCSYVFLSFDLLNMQPNDFF